jgi:oligopeptide/dipeptide ABC transporter ATP-binding protein
MTGPLLELDRVRVDLRIGRTMRTVIHDASLTIGTGEAVGLVGESGAGKSMTVRAVVRLLPPGAAVQGSVRFGGEQVLSMSREGLRRFRARQVAMIFQDPRAHTNPVRTIGDFLTEGLVTTQGMRRAAAAERVTGLLRQVGIDNADRRLRQRPHELSGGLLQRVMIAAALATEPRLLLADEPTTALDVTTQAGVMAILDQQRRARGLAMIFVTHDLELAAAVCDRVAVMYAGSVVEDLRAEALRQHALHPYTAGLLASRPSATERVARLAAISGRPLSAFEAGSGCPFAPRCAFAEDRCHAERPALRDLDGGRVACHRAEELRGRLTASPARDMT